MIIYYSPEYSGFTYTGLKDKGGILFDTAVVDTGGLINLLCLHGGMHYEVHDETERVIAYYKALREYTRKNPNHIFADSFKVDGLNTARTCLSWRDRLVLAGWSKATNAPSTRMKALQGIENLFDCKGIVDTIPLVLAAIKGGCTLPVEMEILTPCDYSLYHPAEVSLLKALIDRGVNVSEIKAAKKQENCNLDIVTKLLGSKKDKKVTFNKNDHSLQIWNFEDKDHALSYITHLDENEFDIWIDSNSKAIDNWLKMEGKPTTGSVASQCIPQTSELYIIGLGLFSKPLNVNSLLEWLYSPISPVGNWFARILAAEIVRQGGYFNKECRQIIDNYIDGKYEWFAEGTTDEEKTEAIKNGRKKRENVVSTFLPNIKEAKLYSTDIINNDVEVDKLLNFTTSIITWCRTRISLSDNEDLISQLGKVMSEANAVVMLLEDYDKETIPYSTLESWMGCLNSFSDYCQYKAQRGCRTLIASPGNIAAKSSRTIWCDFVGNEPLRLTYSFLTPTEKGAFNHCLSLWDEAKEQKFRSNILLLPFKMTADKLVLVTYERDGSAEVEKHPLTIRLEQQAATKEKGEKERLKDITIKPEFDQRLYKEEKVIDNSCHDEEFIRILRPELIKFPKYESYSSLDVMFQSPVDYAFQYLAWLRPKGVSSMPRIWTTKGTVAHKVIQTLFWDKENPQNGYPENIKKNLDENYDRVFTETLNAYGAIMLLQENNIDTRTFKVQLKQCAMRLLEIINLNHLHVTGIETKVDNEIGFADGIEIIGFIDMLLADDLQHPYIFDLKWSIPRKFLESLRTNKSLQLALYRELVNSKNRQKVMGTGYFIMPEGQLFTLDHFERTNNITTVTIDDDRKASDLIDEAKNTYAYRRKQIEQGLLENTEGLPVDDIQYTKDQEEANLMPVETIKPNGEKVVVKAPYKYSNYNSFKR